MRLDLFGWCAFLVLGVAIGICAANAYWKTECVRRGVAEYNATTGEWQWSVSPIESEAPNE